MRNQFLITAILTVAVSGAAAEAKTIRANEITGAQWSEILKAGEPATVEFRRGDEIPVSLSTKGDFLETSQSAVSYVRVKKNFWLRMQGRGIEASLDGSVFRPLNEVAEGTFEAGAEAGEPGVPVSAINLVFTATAK